MKYIWDIILSLAFVLVMAWSLGWLYATGRIVQPVPVYDCVLMALAIFRLIRLFTYDHITEVIRASAASGREGTLRGTLKALFACPWCTGFWCASIVVFAYFATPYAWPVIFILALASAASFLQILANLIGWYAEGEKHEVKVAVREDPVE